MPDPADRAPPPWWRVSSPTRDSSAWPPDAKRVSGRRPPRARSAPPIRAERPRASTRPRPAREYLARQRPEESKPTTHTSASERISKLFGDHGRGIHQARKFIVAD